MPDLVRCIFCGRERWPGERVPTRTIDGALFYCCDPACEALKARLRELGRRA